MEDEFKITGDFTPPPMNLTFLDSNNEVGRFFEKDGKLHFEGNVDESAQIFVKEVIRLFDKKNCGC